MTTSCDFTVNYTAAETPMYQATKPQLMEVCRLLAVNIAHYKREYGELPFQELVDMLRANRCDHEDDTMLATGMQDLVDALNVVLRSRSSSRSAGERR